MIRIQIGALIISALGILISFLLIYAINFGKRHIWLAENYITTNLAVFNIVCGVIQIARSVFIIKESDKQLLVWCTFFCPHFMTLILGLVFNYFLLAFDHFLAAFNANVHRKLFKRRHTIFLIVTTWLLLIASLVYVRCTTPQSEKPPSPGRCRSRRFNIEYLAPLGIIAFAAMVFIVYVNWRIYTTLQRLHQENTNNRAKQNQSRILRSARSLFGISLWLVTTMLSGLIVLLLRKFVPHLVKKMAWDVSFLIMLTNQTSEVVYLITNKEYRKIFCIQKRRSIIVPEIIELD